jgi:hypothetical protein
MGCPGDVRRSTRAIEHCAMSRSRAIAKTAEDADARDGVRAGVKIPGYQTTPESGERGRVSDRPAAIL